MISLSRCLIILTVYLLCLCPITATRAQELNTHFSCSAVRDDGGEVVTYADSGEIHLKSNLILAFHWESAIFRATHGYDCVIDEEDGLTAEKYGEEKQDAWRIKVTDPLVARLNRGYNFQRGLNCSIRLEHSNDLLRIKPSCPALCGSRINFTELSVNLVTRQCQYD